MNLELFPAAQNNGAAGGAAAAGRCNGGLGSDAEKSVVKLGGNCGAVGHQSEVARRRPGGGRYPCLINVRPRLVRAGSAGPGPLWRAALLLINLCKITTVSGKRSTTSRTFRARSSGEGCSALTLQSWGLQTALSWGHLTSHCSTAALVSDAADGWVRGTE